MVVDYLEHHHGIEPRLIPSPIRSLNLRRLVHDHWDASLVESLDNEALFRLVEVSAALAPAPLPPPPA